MAEKHGTLTLVGTGIQPGHVTQETREALERADEVMYVLADPLMTRWLERLRPDSRSLGHLYGVDKPRRETYREMAAELLACMRAGARTCGVFYGHPGVFVDPARLAVAQAREEGYDARLLPAVSSLDCLFADLAIDPGQGCQSYEATAFLVTRRSPDTSSTLVLWQIGAMGTQNRVLAADPHAVGLVAEHLCRFYPPDHEAVLYEAAPFPGCDPSVHRASLCELDAAPISGLSTLVIPPAEAPTADPATLAALGLS